MNPAQAVYLALGVTAALTVLAFVFVFLTRERSDDWRKGFPNRSKHKIAWVVAIGSLVCFLVVLIGGTIFASVIDRMRAEEVARNYVSELTGVPAEDILIEGTTCVETKRGSVILMPAGQGRLNPTPGVRSCITWEGDAVFSGLRRPMRFGLSSAEFLPVQ